MSQRKFSVLNTYEQAPGVKDRGKADSCELCLAKFSLIKRQHQCKRCMRAVCDSCGNIKTDVYKLNFQKRPHRLCKVCKSDSDTIRQFIDSQGLKFKTTSEVGRKWIKKVNGFRQDTNMKNKWSVDFTEDLLTQLWNSLNYSVRQFVGIVTDGIPPKEIHKAMVDVMAAISQQVEIKVQTTPYLILVLLCFCSLESSTQVGVFLLSDLNKINPSKGSIADMLKSMGCNEIELSKIQQYSDTRMRKFFSSFSINMVPFLVSECILEEMILGCQTDLIVKYFCAVMFTEKQVIVSKIKNRDQIDLSFARGIDLNQVRRNFNQLKLQRLQTSPLSSFINQEQPSEVSVSAKRTINVLNQSTVENTLKSEQLIMELRESRNKISIMEIEAKKMKDQIAVYQKQLKENESQIAIYKQHQLRSSRQDSTLDQAEKQRLHFRIDGLERQKELLEKQVEELKLFQPSFRTSSTSGIYAKTLQTNNGSISDCGDLGQLKRELGLLTSTLKDKNAKIHNLSVENKRLSFQMQRTSQQFQVLTQEEKSQSKRMQTLQAQRNKFQQQNVRLLKKLQKLCLNMLDFEETLIQSSKDMFSQGEATLETGG